MLTEAVENGVDSIIIARKSGIPAKGRIRVIIDRRLRVVEIVDDGFGFQNPHHIAEKPFESLKRYDKDLTGRFARGIQGFRAFCGKLTFITRRPEVPTGELLPRDEEHSGKTLKIEFNADRIQVQLQIVSDAEFQHFTDSQTGAVAIYSEWKVGEFERLRTEKLVMRLQHHFGELIRGGGFSIEVVEGSEAVMIDPVDYSIYHRISLEPVPVHDQTGEITIGEVVPELFLMERRKRDRWLYPYLLYKNRPVGDNAIGEIDEFALSSCWLSPYLTGFIRCDFCQINELRLALKAGYERDMLYQAMADLEDKLELILKEHSKGLFEIRMQSQITDLVVELQDFLRKKDVFSFRASRSSNQTLNKPETVPVSGNEGTSTTVVTLLPRGSEVEIPDSTAATLTNAVPGNGEAITLIREVQESEKTAGRTEHFNPFLDSKTPATEDHSGEAAAKPEDGGLRMPTQEANYGSSNGENGNRRRKRAKRRRPQGFALVFQDDEFNNDLSWFDPVTSTVIINSGHPRYKQREGEELAKVKSLMDYLAELYIWEIVKLSASGSESEPENVWNRFLLTKFEFFEGRADG